MTIEEAIKWIQEEKASFERAPDLNGCPMTECWQKAIDVYDMAISALRQQETVTNRNGLNEQMKLVSVSYAQSRLNFFREQLAAANRRLDWSMKHNPDWYDHSEKGEVVSFYEWAVKMAEKEVDDHSICGATNLPCIRCNPGGCDNRKEGADNG